MIAFIFAFTACESPQRVYNPEAEFEAGSSALPDPPTTGPVVQNFEPEISSESPINSEPPIIGGFSPVADPIPGEDSSAASVNHPFENTIIYFAYDSAIVGQAYDAILQQLSSYINNNPGYTLTISGHCDERGSEEYNRALGERRALSVKEALVALGAPDTVINTVSYGEEKPADSGKTQEAFAKNRRAEFEIFAR